MGKITDIMRKAQDREAKRQAKSGAKITRKTAERLAKARKRYVLLLDDDGKLYARRLVVNARAFDGSTATYTVIPARLLPHERVEIAQRVAAHFGPRKSRP